MEQRKNLIDEIVQLEWLQFQKVENDGGRATCQDDYETFEIMRKSQFLTWDTEILESYREDMIESEKQNWNLLMEKYARMMESTAPLEYDVFADQLPKRDEERIKVQEIIISQEVIWAEIMSEKYPNLRGRGRKIRTSQDTPWDSSVETYLRGELGTYSDRTIQLYYQMICRLKQEGKNLTEMNLKYMTELYGYQSLEQAEASCETAV